MQFTIPNIAILETSHKLKHIIRYGDINTIYCTDLKNMNTDAV